MSKSESHLLCATSSNVDELWETMQTDAYCVPMQKEKAAKRDVLSVE